MKKQLLIFIFLIGLLSNNSLSSPIGLNSIVKTKEPSDILNSHQANLEEQKKSDGHLVRRQEEEVGSESENIEDEVDSEDDDSENSSDSERSNRESNEQLLNFVDNSGNNHQCSKEQIDWWTKHTVNHVTHDAKFYASLDAKGRKAFRNRIVKEHLGEIVPDYAFSSLGQCFSYYIKI